MGNVHEEDCNLSTSEKKAARIIEIVTEHPGRTIENMKLMIEDVINHDCEEHLID